MPGPNPPWHVGWDECGIATATHQPTAISFWMSRGVWIDVIAEGASIDSLRLAQLAEEMRAHLRQTAPLHEATNNPTGAEAPAPSAACA